MACGEVAYENDIKLAGAKVKRRKMQMVGGGTSDTKAGITLVRPGGR